MARVIPEEVYRDVMAALRASHLKACDEAQRELGTLAIEVVQQEGFWATDQGEMSIVWVKKAGQEVGDGLGDQ